MRPTLGDVRWQLGKAVINGAAMAAFVGAAIMISDTTARMMNLCAAGMFGLTAVLNVVHWRFLARWRDEGGER